MSVPAWQPMTLGGVAAFASASYLRLLLVELVVSLIATVSAVWFFCAAWEPVFTQAMVRLPDQGEIRRGRLDWPRTSSELLAESPFLSLAVGVPGSAGVGGQADLRVIFAGDRVKLGSLLGYWEVAYPRGWVVAMNRTEVEAWWGARRPIALVGASGLMVAGLLICWHLLAVPYGICLRFVGFWLDLRLSLGAAWRLASAALLPGALVLSGGLVLYGLRRLNLAGLLVAFALHLIIGWVYLFAAPTRLPRSTPIGPRNPFLPSTPDEDPFQTGSSESDSGANSDSDQ